MEKQLEFFQEVKRAGCELSADDFDERGERRRPAPKFDDISFWKSLMRKIRIFLTWTSCRVIGAEQIPRG